MMTTNLRVPKSTAVVVVMVVEVQVALVVMSNEVVAVVVVVVAAAAAVISSAGRPSITTVAEITRGKGWRGSGNSGVESVVSDRCWC